MVDSSKLREFRMRLQSIEDGCSHTPLLSGQLVTNGWIRGVGSCTPYIHFFTRGGRTREDVDQAVANLDIHELPAARGCTYIVPKHHFALALALAQHPSDEPKMDTGERKLGFTWEQIDSLKAAVLDALKSGPADPGQLKEALGDKVKSYGADGKKYGITTDLPGTLQRLQKEGKIRRIPLDGRLDNERYAYALWPDNPLDGFSFSKPEVQAQLAEVYAYSTSPFTLEEFLWFSGFSKRDAVAALQADKISSYDEGYYIHKDNIEIFEEFQADPKPNPQFLTCLDNLILLTRNLALHIDETDHPLIAQIEGKAFATGGLADLANHPIFDRGRLVGLWAYDEPNQELVYTAWASDKDLITQRAAETQTFIQEQLGDARSFSLDSPKSREPRIKSLREQPNYHG